MKLRSSSRARSPLAIALLAALGAILSACGGGASEPRGPGTLGDYSLDERALALYLRAEVGIDPAEVDPEALEQLRAELFEETVLAVAAEDARLVPTSAALGLERDRLVAALVATATPQEIDRAARRRVMAQLYEQTVLLPQVGLDPARFDREVAKAEAEAAAAAPPSEIVVFRQIRADDPGAADRAFRRLTHGESFESVAEGLSQSPDRGRPLQRALADLPPPAADALRRLPEGGVSRPIALDGAYYVFQLDARSVPFPVEPGSAGPGDGPEAPGLEGSPPDAVPAVDRREIAQRLRREALDELRERTVAELARRKGVTPPFGTKGD